ncbi:MAG: ABC transporter permease [Candidatus Njordarchaeia archaeon]
MVNLKLHLPKIRFNIVDIYEKSLNPVIAVILGIVISNIFLVITGYNPFLATRALILGSIGTPFSIASSLSRSVPVMLTGLAFAVAARAKLFNIGTEGQFYMGALVAVLIGAYFTVWTPIHMLIIFIASFIVGMLWALPAALLKIYRGINEVISTIMLNWIAYYFILFIVVRVIYDPAYPYKSVRVNNSATFPQLMYGTDLTYAIFAAVIFAFLTYVYLWLTVDGYEIRAVGSNPHAAKYAGVNSNMVIMKAMLISGGLAGLGGALHIMSVAKYIDATMSNITNYGFDGITVSLLGRNHPIGIIFAAIFLGGLKAANPRMQIEAGVPKEIAQISQGIIILFVAIPSIIDLFKKPKAEIEEGEGSLETEKEIEVKEVS